MNQTLIKFAAAIGSFLLLTVTYKHFQSMDGVRSIIANIDDVFIKNAIIPLWILISVQFLFIALLAFGASFYRSKYCAAFLIGFGIWVLVDAAIVWSHNGWFSAVPMLLGAGGLYLIAGLFLRRAAHA